jgi:cell division protein FtsW (lipid II flippase)
MEMLRVYVLPVILALGAVLLLAVETRTLQNDLGQKTPRWVRFGRRVAGALTIAAIGFMMHFARSLPTAGESQETVWNQFYYWIWVLGLVCFALFLAVWDVMDSIRTLKKHLETVEREEFVRLQERLKMRK